MTMELHNGKTEQAQDAETQSLEEMVEVLTGVKDRAAKENKRITDATDSEYWIAVCSQTRAQKEELLQKLGLLAEGDKYIDGLALARAMGIVIESPTPTMPKLKTDPKLTKLALPLPEKKG